LWKSGQIREVGTTAEISSKGEGVGRRGNVLVGGKKKMGALHVRPACSCVAKFGGKSTNRDAVRRGVKKNTDGRLRLKTLDRTEMGHFLSRKKKANEGGKQPVKENRKK